MKHLILLIISAICIISCTPNNTSTQSRSNELRFKDGKFKIAQFTDIHINPNDPRNESVAETLLTVLEKEQPNLVVMTGDIVTNQPADKGWQFIIDMMSKAGIP